MKKFALLSLGIVLLAAGCHKATTTINPPPPKPDYTITDNQPGIRTYTSEKFNFSFNFPNDFTLQESVPYNYTGTDKKLISSAQINVTKGKDVKFYITTNPQTMGCGSDVKKISSKTIDVNGQKITRTQNSQPRVDTTCLEYAGFANGTNTLYMVGFMPITDTADIPVFDAIASSFKYLK